MNTWDPQQLVATVRGALISGWAEGTFLTVERNEDAYTLKVGADGEAARSRNHNKSGTVKFTLMQTAQSNSTLASLHAEDEAFGTGLGPLLIKDLTGTTVAAAQNCWIKKTAAASFGKEVEDREWTLECDSLELFTGGAS